MERSKAELTRKCACGAAERGVGWGGAGGGARVRRGGLARTARFLLLTRGREQALLAGSAAVAGRGAADSSPRRLGSCGGRRSPRSSPSDSRRRAEANRRMRAAAPPRRAAAPTRDGSGAGRRWSIEGGEGGRPLREASSIEISWCRQMRRATSYSGAAAPLSADSGGPPPSPPSAARHELVGVAAARNRGERLEGEADRGARRARLEHDCEHVPRALDVGARQLLEGAHRDAVRREPHDLLLAGRARSARIKDGGPVELHDGLAWGPEQRRVLEHSLQSRAQGLAGDPHAKLWRRLTAQADPRASVAGMLSGNKVDALGLGRLAGNAHARRRRHAASAA